MYNKLRYLPAIFLIATLLVSCGVDKAIKKGDRYAAIMEYYEAAKEYKSAYRRISPKDRKKRGTVAWKMAECYRKMNSPVFAVGAYQNAVRYGYPDSLALLYLADAQLEKGDYKASQ